jgi:hypothetical protein
MSALPPTMPKLAKLSRAFAALCGIVALYWFILPFAQAAVGMYEGGLTVFVCWFIAGFFAMTGAALFFCHLVTRSGEIGQIARVVIWIFVIAAGLIGSAMAFRILWSFIP